MPSSRFRLITFDLDDTLWPCIPVIESAEQALLDWLRQHAPRLTDAHDIASMRAHRQTLMTRMPEIAHDLQQIRQRSLAHLLECFDYPVELAERGVRLFMTHRNRVTPYADVIPALRRLGQRHQLISLTNGNADVSITSLRGLFTYSLNAVDVGAAKPDPALFLRALELSDCMPEQALHIGDDPQRDVEAARACGMTAIWINRSGQDWPAELEPPALAATDLGQVVAWLGS